MTIIKIQGVKYKKVSTPIEILLAIYTGDLRGVSPISCKATKYDEKGKPSSWGIYKGNCALSKSDLEFCYEPSPSSRDEAFFKEFRFSTYKEARDFFEKSFPGDK